MSDTQYLLSTSQHDINILSSNNSIVIRSKRSQGSVCYGEFGCFEDAGPFAYLETLPSTPQEVGTQFLLYSTVSRYVKKFLQKAVKASSNMTLQPMITNVSQRGRGSEYQPSFILSLVST